MTATTGIIYKPAESQNRTDRVRTEVQRRLHECSHLFSRNIACDFHEGVVILRGRVDRYYHKQIAQTIAAAVDGVGQVLNHIEVSDG